MVERCNIMKRKSLKISNLIKTKRYKVSKKCPICDKPHIAPCSPIWILVGGSYQGLCMTCAEECCNDLLKKSISMRDEWCLSVRRSERNIDNENLINIFFAI